MRLQLPNSSTDNRLRAMARHRDNRATVRHPASITASLKVLHRANTMDVLPRALLRDNSMEAAATEALHLLGTMAGRADTQVVLLPGSISHQQLTVDTSKPHQARPRNLVPVTCPVKCQT